LELPKRKNIRLKDYDYSSNGAYFVTICVKDRHELLGEIVGRDVLIALTVRLSEYGNVVDKHINIINSSSKSAIIDKYIQTVKELLSHVLFREKSFRATGAGSLCSWSEKIEILML